MTKFEIVRAVNGIKEFSAIVYDLANTADTAEQLERMLSEELTEEGLRTIKSVAQRGTYPLSLDGLQ